MKRITCIAICLLAIFLWGCPDDDGVEPDPDTGVDTGVDADPETDAGDDGVAAAIVFPTETFVIEENDPTEPSAEVLDADGNIIDDAFIAWESADPSIIHISGGGFALGEQPGTTELIATSGDVTEHWPAEVVPTLIGTVTVIPAEAQLLVDGTILYGVVLEDHHGFPIDDDRPVDWSTTDASIATIDDDGIATGVSAGQVDVVAVVDEMEASAELSVTDADVESVQITPGYISAIPEGGDFQLEATAYDIEDNPLHGHSAQWSSSDEGVATVDDGLVTGVEQGEATITATIDGVEDSVDVDVIFEVQSVASGDGFSCVIATYRLFCWGTNDDGQLADGGFQARSHAEPADFPHTVEQLSLGASHGCLVDAEDQVWCWGANDHGQLGRPAGNAEPTPQLVDSSNSFRQVAAGDRHSCAVTDDDEVWCWGSNDSGQLGASGGSSHEPTAVSGPSFTSVTAGNSHSCAIAANATAYCWGDNSRRQLGGDTEASSSNSPVPIIGGNEFAVISAGADHTCGIDPSGPPACWGANDRGQLGSGDTTDHAVPRSLSLQPGQGLNAINSGDVHTCGRVPDEGIHCWGAYEDGRLGTDTGDDATSPVAIDSDEEFVEIAAGAAHACGRTPDHRVLCWGGAPADGSNVVDVQF